MVLDDTADLFYPVDPAITIIQQPLSFGITPEGNVITRKIKLLSDVLKLRKLVKQLLPDLIIATEYPFSVATILSGAKKYSKIVSWEHHHFYELKRNTFWEKMFRLSYPKLDAVVCLNEDEKKLFSNVNTHAFVIPNFISVSDNSAALTGKIILTVARLTAVKGIDLLMKTSKLILQQNPEWQWKIIGKGDMKEEVMQFIEKESLQNKLIIQPPVDHNILSEYQNASLYVMTSRNECFPMVLLEAQSAGLPCIAFDCDTGPRHIIRHNENGILVEKENPGKLTETISALITDEEKRKRMSENALFTIQQFAPEKITELWKQVFLMPDKIE